MEGNFGTRRGGLTTVHHLQEAPTFGSEAEEHAFWATHDLSDALWDQAEPLAPAELPPPRLATTPVVVHLDDPPLPRLKALARRRHKGYGALLDELVRERIEQAEREERRAGRRQARESSAG